MSLGFKVGQLTKKLVVALLAFVTFGCATADHYQALHVGMPKAEVEALIGTPELSRENEQSSTHIYSARYAPKWWALTGCVAVPLVVPVTVVMLLSDACLGEHVEIEVQYQNEHLTSRQLLNEE